MLATTGPLVLLLAAGSAGGLLEGHVGAGGGYQGNVTLATAGSPVSGSGLATAWAALGLGWDPGDSTSLHGGLRYDGAFYPGATDLVPYLANATESTLAPSFEAVVWEGLYLFATYAYTWGSSTEGSYTVQYALGGAGYRL